MRITADRSVLADAVAKAARGVPDNPAPEHAGIVVSAGHEITLTSGDRDIQVKVVLPGDISEPGRVVLPGEMFREIASGGPGRAGYLPSGAVRMTAEGTTARISAGRTAITMTTMDVQLVPHWTSVPPSVSVNAAELNRALKIVTVAASTTHPVRSCVALSCTDRVWLACTDATRMAMVPLEATIITEPGEQVLVPARILARFRTALAGDAYLGWDDRLVTLSSAGMSITSRTVTGIFPPWQNLFPGDDLDWTGISGSELRRAVTMALLTEPENGTIRLHAERGSLTVSALGERGHAEEVIAMFYTGKPVTIAAGGEMLLSELPGEDAEIALQQPPKPFCLRGPAFPGAAWLVQPRRSVLTPGQAGSQRRNCAGTWQRPHRQSAADQVSVQSRWFVQARYTASSCGQSWVKKSRQDAAAGQVAPADPQPGCIVVKSHPASRSQTGRSVTAVVSSVMLIRAPRLR
jgi:DNA polymerase-3 subunit beta